MFVRVNNMESAMGITYSDIQQQRHLLQNKYDLRRSELQQHGFKLINEYRASLELDRNTWIDTSGAEHAYVRSGEIDDAGKFKAKPLAAFDLDRDYKLKFKISTAVDDVSGSYYLVTAALWKEEGRLYVEVGAGGKVIIVATPSEDGAFYEVSSAIKQIIISSFTDPRLD